MFSIFLFLKTHINNGCKEGEVVSMDTEEIWSAIEGYPEYEVSSLGRVKSYKRGREHILKCIINKDGYYVVSLCQKGTVRQHLVHRLVANAFIPNPKNLSTVNHLDEQKLNNHVENLEWCSIRDNLAYGTRVQRMREKLIKNGHYAKIAEKKKRPVVQYSFDGKLMQKYDSLTQAGLYLGRQHGNVNIVRCCMGITNSAYGYVWRYYNEEISDSVI